MQHILATILRQGPKALAWGQLVLLADVTVGRTGCFVCRRFCGIVCEVVRASLMLSHDGSMAMMRDSNGL